MKTSQLFGPIERVAWRAGVVLLVAAGTANAQVSTGGKGGGLPGGGPGTSSTPGSSTGGRTQDDLATIEHVLDRVTYGGNRADVALVRQLGLENYLRLQLHPTLIPESSVLTTKQATLPPVYTAVGDPRWDWNSLYADNIWRAHYGNRQLNEVMTQFWENHFDTGLDVGAGGFTGFFTSLAYDPTNNETTIAYYDQSGNRPRFARYTGGAWTQMNIDNTRGNGYFTSLAYNPVTRQPSVAYYSLVNQELKFATWNGTAWTLQVVDTTGNVGGWSSLGFDSTGQAYIAYYDYDTLQLKMASSNGGPWTIQVVDGTADVGWFASLEVDSTGRPGIAYYDNTNAMLKYARYNGATWAIEVVDPVAGTGSWGSLAYDSTNQPAISYRDENQGALSYAIKRAGVWNITTVDNAADVGEYTSLAFAPSGNPAIAYFDKSNYNLKYASFNGTAWTVTNVLNTVSIEGEWSSLAFHPVTGNPAISHYNGSRFYLRNAEFNGTAWATRTVDSYGTSMFVYTVWEMLESDGFRQNALGKFRDLLDVSAKSAAMMLFLNNDQNTAGNGNENYARELLELHTLGVDGGYTQLDVETTARAVTGWGLSITSPRCDVRIGDFCYNHLAHDGSAKTIMGRNFTADTLPNDPTGWMRQGNEVLDFLAVHPETARFICWKLIQKFVNDDVPAGLHEQCRSTFLSTDGDIRRVMETILFSRDFLGTDNRLNKVRDPLEYTLAAARKLESDSDGIGLWVTASTLGMPLFRNTVPTGYAEVGLEWISTNSFLQRWRYADALTHANRGAIVNPLAMVAGVGLTTSDSVVKFFGGMLLRGELGSFEQSLLVDCLDAGVPGSWNITSAAADGRVRDMVGVMLGFPIFEKQ